MLSLSTNPPNKSNKRSYAMSVQDENTSVITSQPNNKYSKLSSTTSQLPIIDRATTLPIINLQLPAPAPHSEGSNQRLIPSATETTIDEVAPRTIAVTTQSRTNRGYQTISHETPEDIEHAAQLRDYHVQYFRQLKTWFKTGYRYRQLRYRDRLSQLGIINPQVEKLYATALRAAVLAQSSSSNSSSASSEEMSHSLPNVTSPSNAHSYPIISDSPRTTLAAIVNLAKTTELHPNLLNSPVPVRNTYVRQIDSSNRYGSSSSSSSSSSILLTPNPHINTDNTGNPLLTTPGIGSAQAARSLANFASTYGGIESLNSNTNSNILYSRMNNAPGGLQSPPPPRRIAGQFNAMTSKNTDNDSYFNVNAPGLWGRSLFHPTEENSQNTDTLRVKANTTLLSSHTAVHSPKNAVIEAYPSETATTIPTLSHQPSSNTEEIHANTISSSPVQLNQIADILTTLTSTSSNTEN